MPEEIAAIWAAIGTAAASEVGTAVIAGGTSAAVGAGAAYALAPKVPGQKAATPLPNQSAIDEAKKRSVLLQRQRAGRESTILSQTAGDTLG